MPEPESNGAPISDASRPPRAWLAQVFMRLEGPLVGYTRQRLRGNVELARDVVQEAFVKLCGQAWPEIESYATAWLYRTCRNRAIDLCRREERMSTAESHTEVHSLMDHHGQTPDELTSQNEQLALVRVLVERLPDKQQDVLRLRLQNNLSYKEIADVTGMTVTNVGYHLHQAIASLRAAMQTE